MKPLWAVAGVALLGAAGAGTLTAAYVVLPREEEVGTDDSQAQALGSADFLVTTTADAVDAAPGDGACATAAGECSLRAAVQESNALSGKQSVEVPAGTYKLTITGDYEDRSATGDLDIADDVVIAGSGSAETIVDGGRLDGLFHIQPRASLDLRRMKVTNGHAKGALPETPRQPEGGGIYNEGTLTAEDVDIANNVADFAGGGLANPGVATLRNSRIRGNTAPNGGAVGNQLGGAGNSLTLIDSIVTDNRDDHAGSRGGIFAPTADVEVIRSSILNNLGVGVSIGNFRQLKVEGSTIANNDGGGISAQGAVTIRNSTISGNSAKGGNGGGIFGTGSLRIQNITLVDNVADWDSDGNGNAAAIYWMQVAPDAPGAANRSEVANSIIAGNIDDGGESTDCYPVLVSVGHNLLEPASCINPVDGDIIGVQALLGPLADNGGPTQTHALLAGSPAIDAGSPGAPGAEGACEATDQRGVARPQGERCDIGAFEVEVADSSVSETATPTPTPSPATSRPSTTPAPAPKGYTTYMHPGSERSAPAFSFAYPAAWFASGGGEPPEGTTGLTIILTPWDPQTAPGRGGIPPNSMKVDMYAIPLVPNGEGLCPQGNSESTTLAGDAGWTSTGLVDRQPQEVAYRLVGADHAGFRYCITGYFADPPDPTIFDVIVETFRFLE